MKRIFTLGVFLIAANIHGATKSLDQLFLIQRSSDGDRTIIFPKEVPAACAIHYQLNNVTRKKILVFLHLNQRNFITDSNKITSIEPVDLLSLDALLFIKYNNVNLD